jgi:hypothetical protein
VQVADSRDGGPADDSPLYTGQDVDPGQHGQVVAA